MTSELRALEAIHAIAENRSHLTSNLIEEIVSSKPGLLLRTAIFANGSPRARALIDKHIEDQVWRIRIPLDFQEYRVLLPSDVHFDKPMSLALNVTTWTDSYLRRFVEAREPSEVVALELLADFEALAEEGARLAELANIIRSRVVPPLHLLHAQLLTRMALALGPLKGLSVLEVGPEDGALLLELERLGANVFSIDLAPKFNHVGLHRGDFMSFALPNQAFDLIVATAVFEEGSEGDGIAKALTANRTPALLDRFASLLKPGGHVFLENLREPIPFSALDACTGGFDVLDVRVPGINLRFGGRGCALRLRRGLQAHSQRDTP